MVLRNLTEGDQVMGGWRKQHNEGLHNLYSLPSIIRLMKWMRWVGHVAQMGEKRNMCKLLVGKPKGKSPLGRPRCRWVDSSKMNLAEIGSGGVYWIDLAQDMYNQASNCNKELL
jgi:hypothetical protein